MQNNQTHTRSNFVIKAVDEAKGESAESGGRQEVNKDKMNGERRKRTLLSILGAFFR